jgi:diguanylate cyclase (GGDEF)-like protein
VGFFVLVTDISARVVAEQRMAQALSTWRALARSLPSGFVLVFDEELRFRVADGVELAAFGTTRESLEGRTLHEVATSALAQEVEPFFRGALAGKTVSWERALGHRTFQFTAGPVVDPVDAPPDPGTGRTGLVVALDITARRVHERTWAALHAVATDVANKCTPSEIAEHVAVSLVAVFGGDTSAVVRYTGQTTADVIAMAPRDPETAADVLTFAPGDSSIVARVHESREPVLTRYDEDGGSISRRATSSGFRSGAGAPIRYRGELWGAIALASRREDALGESVLTALTRFAQLVELAIGTTESWDTLLREAQVDDLTGLPNRRTFHAHLKREIDRAERHERPLSLAMLDLDHFKLVNDRHGHAVGDAVLAGLGKRLRAMCREGEIVARLGGEEFAWIMPETSGDAAVAAAERLRQDVSSLPFPVVGVLRVSIGVCSLQPSLDSDALLSRADEALYAAKGSGRDQVTLWEPRPAPL